MPVLHGGPFLNALLDDVAVYEVALDEGQIAGRWRDWIRFLPIPPRPLPSRLIPPNRAPSTTPVAPITTTSPGIDLNQPSPLFGIPVWSMILILVLLSLFVLLSVVLSLIEVFRRKREAGGPKR